MNISLGKLRVPIFIVATIASLFGVIGCNTPSKMKELMSSWMGMNVNDLIAAWGPPTSTMSDGNGGQILIYDQSRTMVLPGSAQTTTNVNATTNGNVFGGPGYANYNGYTNATANTHTTYTPPSQINVNRQRLLWADSSGRLYRWSWKGL